MRFIEFTLHDSKEKTTVHVRSDVIVTMQSRFPARSDMAHTVVGLANGATIAVKATVEDIREELELIQMEELELGETVTLEPGTDVAADGTTSTEQPATGKRGART